ncbi:FtsK/SpoIIIE domain-containing protein [Enterococcus sp. HY326]|uniref:FtsK/SpoIIIE domain-containing protein n=1 Tax=Enterococcus sp. HY326 TaxID=2971265 RepID=UPI00223EE8C2|nr:FtsK/SpoIIIE domain-containing protein [Enterococcus sp. HY326]
MSKLFVYRGIRIRKFHLHIYGFYQFIWFIPFLVGAGCYGYFVLYPYFQLNSQSDWLATLFQVLPLLGILVGGFFVVYFLSRLSYSRNGFFSRVRERRNLANMIVENCFFTLKKRKGNSTSGRPAAKDKMKFPRIYYRNKKNLISIFLPMDGNKNQEKYMKMGTFLEDMFLADNMGILNHKGFVEYRLLSNVEASRLKVTDMKATKESVLLMRGVSWKFNSDPHLLIGGGTGGGKTFTMMSIILALLPVAEVEICDPKDADLSTLSRLPVFEGKVFTGLGILGCLRRGVDDMVKRYKIMKESPKFKMGKNYSYYDIPPKFIVIDEWAAFMTELETMENGYKLLQEANGYMTQLILKARQAGIFIILAMQRPDGQYIQTALRDNFMFRMSVGKLSDVGYDMIFGDVNKDKHFKTKDVKGHGYLGKGGTLAQEFYSAFVPKDFDFAEAYSSYESQVSLDLAEIELSVSEKKDLLKEMEKNRLATNE